MIETQRLILRSWREADRAVYAAMMADPDVADWLGGVLTREAADAQFDRCVAHLLVNGFGFLAIERKSDSAFLGAAGLARVKDERNPLFGAVEIGWRLTRDAWGEGYASEAAQALLAWGFNRHGLESIIAFTTDSNLRSQAVMTRIGMRRREDLDFKHPGLALDHPLRPHVVFEVRPDAAAVPPARSLDPATNP
jgi:RimJ/RimL family protein N-acetyltransferase